MEKIAVRFLIFLFFLIPIMPLLAQDQVEILQAEALEGKIINGEEVRILTRNVIVRHEGMILYCDSAIQFEESNRVDAYRNARLVNGDGSVVTSTNMFYDGNSKMARAVGNVRLVDEGKTLTTEELDYNTISKVAYYSSGGKIVDSKNILTSQTGTYDTNSKIFYFKKDVVLIGKEDGEVLETDDLTYNTVTEVAYFEGPTTITDEDGATLQSTSGVYDTKTKISRFRGRPTVENDKYILTGDSLYYDDLNDEGIAIGNTELTAKEDSVIINGEISQFWGDKNRSEVYGNVLARQISEEDTLFLMADTLVSISNEEENQKYLLAYHNARVFRTDMQAICDSLVYNRSDSVMYFYEDPVIWSGDNQMTADSIHAFISNNKLKQLNLRQNSFVIELDTLLNYNQLKGKYLTAYFLDNQIKRINVDSNGESLYFVLEGDTLLKGVNRALCSSMVFLFQNDNKLETITYIENVEAKFIPPQELEEPDKRLKDFIWREKEKPKREEFVIKPIGLNTQLE